MRYFDLHCDTMAACCMRDKPLRKNDMHISLEKAEAIETYTQCYAVFVHDSLRGKDASDFFSKVADRFSLEMGRNSDLISPCNKPGDLDAISADHRHGGILTVEGGAALGGTLDNLEEWVRRGVKMCTLTWNGDNEIGKGVLGSLDVGLTDFGKEVIKAFEANGIIVDISHASPELFWDVEKMATRPLVASHSNSKELCRHVRNLTDEQFKAVKASGGLVGLNYYTEFINDEPEKACMEDILAHAEHFLNLGGEDIIAMGGDMDGSTMPDDMKDGLAAIPRLYEKFCARFGAEISDKIFYTNAAEFFKKYAAL